MTASSPQFITTLEAIVGPQGLITDQQEMRGYEVGARYDEGRAALVVRPCSTAEVSAVVGLCVRQGVTLIPQGGNTGLVGASTPDGSGGQVVLSLDRLQAPLDVDAENRSIRVGAGVRLSTVNAVLGPAGLWLPIDLGADPTIGGMVATNTGGARFIRYGDMRRQTLGLEVVLADEAGTVIELKRGVRKDNTGLDLRQLFVGGGGGFGVVTRVELEVQRLPRQVATALVLLTGADAALPLLAHFEREAGELLSAFEGMSEAALKRAIAHSPRLRDPFANGGTAPYAVLVELSCVRPPRIGEAPLEKVLEACLAEWWERSEDTTVDALFGRAEDLWAIRHAIPEGLRASGRVTGFDLAFRRSDLAAFRSLMIEKLAADFPEFAVCDFGHIGDGGVHFNLVCDPAQAPDEARTRALRNCVYDIAVGQFGGSFSGEHGLGRTNLPYYRTYTSHVVQALSGAVQQAFTAAPLGVVDYALPPDAAVKRLVVVQ
jgi:FAD/FMN-containing dehydrogenase